MLAPHDEEDDDDDWRSLPSGRRIYGPQCPSAAQNALSLEERFSGGMRSDRGRGMEGKWRGTVRAETREAEREAEVHKIILDSDSLQLAKPIGSVKKAREATCIRRSQTHNPPALGEDKAKAQ
ncbi:unnamed protein product [Pleuronectes platessa]|uniref:Uncharacterized protein n=1 Tax=Pleuronectes platessa TaxID=8262 RepID=A0A9N7YMH1_PLEPL|nr:unnamed protein product [Pleuronectes platessa]